MFSFNWLGLLPLLVGVASGCGGPPTAYLVHGTVVFPDGTPLTRGTVEFEAIGQKKPITASAEIAADGTFQLGTYQPKDGAIAGEHRVAVISDYEIGTGIERPGELPPPVLHSKYRSFKTSGLKFLIKPRMNNLLIQVEHPPAEATK